jgi:hypothetical protein
MKLLTEPYLKQLERLPKEGAHILAQFDRESVVVYQAYRPAIGDFAAKQGYFGGEFSLNRMSWIKPNFLWMMYRSGWGQKSGQEVILAVRIQRTAFDHILAIAVHSSFNSKLYPNQKEWEMTIKSSSVRLQWDPDHDPLGRKLERRAIQLGLRDEILKSYTKDWIIDIEDISEFVSEQRQHLSPPYSQLQMPQENVYPVSDPQVATRLQLSNDRRGNPPVVAQIPGVGTGALPLQIQK